MPLHLSRRPYPSRRVTAMWRRVRRAQAQLRAGWPPGEVASDLARDALAKARPRRGGP